MMAVDLRDVVATMAHQTCEVMVAHAAADNAVFVVTSPVAGVGKTTSTLVAAQRTGRACVHVVMSPGTNASGVNAEVLLAAGVAAPRSAPLWEATAETVELLVDMAPILMVDDAHRLSPEALAHLEVLHRRSRCTLGLVGGPTLGRRHQCHVEVFDRVERWVEMAPLNRVAMIDALTQWHPLFAKAPRARLVDIDASYARGRWRRWSQFLTAALRYTDRGASPLSDATIDHILTALNWQIRPEQ